MTALKFPGRALLLEVAEFLLPAGDKAVFSASLIYQQEINLSLNMCGNCSPSLLITVNSFQRHSEEF